MRGVGRRPRPPLPGADPPRPSCPLRTHPAPPHPPAPSLQSLTEHRSADTLNKLTAAQKALKDATAAAYVDLGLASAEREAGNAAFKDGRYPEAVKHYTEALARGPPGVNADAHKLLSNRAACYTKLGAWADGVKDADACISLAPDFAKGYSRKASWRGSGGPEVGSGCAQRVGQVGAHQPSPHGVHPTHPATHPTPTL